MTDQISFDRVETDQEEPVIVPELQLERGTPYFIGSESETDDNDLNLVT